MASRWPLGAVFVVAVLALVGDALVLEYGKTIDPSTATYGWGWEERVRQGPVPRGRVCGGGAGTLRGYRKDRFGGQRSVYGNAELRLRLSRIKFLLPGEFGVFGGLDTGRVFLESDPSTADKWHTGVEGGIWLSLLQRSNTLSLAFEKGDDLTGFYLRSGFMF